MKWTLGDADECRAAAQSLRTMAGNLESAVSTLRGESDWRGQNWWTGVAADAAAAQWAAFLDKTGEVGAAMTALAAQLDTAAGQIDNATTRAKHSLIIGGVVFIVATGLTILTVGLSEGAAAGAGAAALAEVDTIETGLYVLLRRGFTEVLGRTALRSASSVGFQTVIPAVGVAAYDGVTKRPLTWDQVGETLTASGMGMLVGEFGMAAQLSLKPGLLGSVAIGAGSQGAVGALSSVVVQAEHGSKIQLKVVGVNSAIGAITGGIGAGVTGAIIEHYEPSVPLAPNSEAMELEMTPLGQNGAPDGPPSDVSVQVVSDPITGETSMIAQNADGRPTLNAAQLAALPEAEFNRLYAAQSRLTAAAQYTAEATPIGRLAYGADEVEVVDAVLARLNDDTSPIAEADRAFLLTQAQAAQHYGGELRAQLQELQALDGQAAEQLGGSTATVAAGDPGGGLSRIGGGDVCNAGVQARSAALIKQIRQTAGNYVIQLQTVQHELALAGRAPGSQPNIIAAGGSSPALAAAIANGQAVQRWQPRLPTLHEEPPGAKPEAIKRIIATSANGIVIGGTSGAINGSLVEPHLPGGDPNPLDPTAVPPGSGTTPSPDDPSDIMNQAAAADAAQTNAALSASSAAGASASAAAHSAQTATATASADAGDSLAGPSTAAAAAAADTDATNAAADAALAARAAGHSDVAAARADAANAAAAAAAAAGETNITPLSPQPLV